MTLAINFSNPFAGFIGINTNDIELTDGILILKVVMNLGPAESNDFSIMYAEEETRRIQPRFVHSVFKICHRPISLVRMVGKDAVVEF